MAALDTMVPDANVNHVPVLTGGVGRDQLKEFYSQHFIPNMPPDMEVVPIPRTIGSDRLVDEMIFRFTHSNEMDWMLPGVAPTGKRVEYATVAIVQFRDVSFSTSTFTGTKLRYSFSSDFLIFPRFPSQVWKQQERLRIPAAPSQPLDAEGRNWSSSMGPVAGIGWISRAKRTLGRVGR